MAPDIADFDFDLPPDRIAQHPARPRDAARLLHVTRGGLADRAVRDLPQLLRPGDVLVANDTRVIPAQLTAHRVRACGRDTHAGDAHAGDAHAGDAHTGDTHTARIGITLDRPRADGAWHVLARNARRLRAGDTLRFDGANDLTATVLRTRPGWRGGPGLQPARRGVRGGPASGGSAGTAALHRPPARPRAGGREPTTRPSSHPRGRGRRPHRRPALHPCPAGGAGGTRRPACHADAACRCRHIPARPRR